MKNTMQPLIDITVTDYRCCELQHSSYCPQCMGKTCKSRLTYGLDPKGGNDKKLKELRERLIKGE